MKKFFNIYIKTFFVMSLFMTVLAAYVYRTTGFQAPYNMIVIATLLIGIFISLAITVFKSEKGKGWVNAILGYIIIIPALYIIKNLYNDQLFRFAYTIYIIMAIIGVIYGVALLAASKKYKTEVDELNRLLLEKEFLEDEEEN